MPTKRKEPTLYDWFDADGNVVDRGLSFADARFIHSGVSGLTRRLSVSYLVSGEVTEADIAASEVTHA